MNDTELDDVLDKWTAPPAPASLRANVRAGFVKSAERARWRPGWFAAASVALAAVLLIVTQAFPQIPRAVPPFTVDSEFITYDERGSPTVEMYSTSYAKNGQEVVLSRSVPGDPLATVFWQTLDVVRAAMQRLTLPFLVDDEDRKKVREASKNTVSFSIGRHPSRYFYGPKASGDPDNGCSDGTLAGRETILNHPTAATYAPVIYKHRVTVWRAPDLGCIALKVTIEAPKPDGTFRLISKKQALKVNINP